MKNLELYAVLYTTTLLVASTWAGCGYNYMKGEYSCGEHGVCKETELNPLMVLRYCVCDKGYSGKETCNQPCTDCCQQMADQCYSKRYKAQCKIPRCLSKVLNSRKCPKDSASRKEITTRRISYLSACNKYQ